MLLGAVASLLVLVGLWKLGATGFLMGIAFLLAVPLYCLPSILGRSTRNWKGIMAVNLLLGWTGVGWGAALIWAAWSLRCEREKRAVYSSSTNTTSSPVAIP